MPTVYLETYIEAPIERCFDLALSVDLHPLLVAHTQERALAVWPDSLTAAECITRYLWFISESTGRLLMCAIWVQWR